MSDSLDKPETEPVRLAKRPSLVADKSTSYRVSKAQSLRMRAYDQKIDEQEARKAKKLARAEKAR
jgi:hypothetical protein